MNAPKPTLLLLLTALTGALPIQELHAQKPQPWRMWLESPGGELPFQLEVLADQAFIINGPERIYIDNVEEAEGADGRLAFSIPPYDSRIEAEIHGDQLTGRWTKVRPGTNTEMVVRGQKGRHPRFHVEKALPSAAFAGRWQVWFDSDKKHPAVGEFIHTGKNGLLGTFRTALGDYRYLAGDRHDDTMRLSCFDGAHAFLFTAKMQPDGSLRGDFWSSATWHETWTATRHPDAQLPDAFTMTRWQKTTDLAALSYPDLEGRMRSLADPEFQGKARILQVFGSWCPNCNDASRYLGELDRRYRDKGLRILGLAFEHGNDVARNVRQVRAYKKRNDADYPSLIAGPSDKGKATKAFPALDRVRSYPTTIFLDGQGRVRAVHTGFDGPATGAAHTRLRERFETLIEEMLAGQ